MILHAASIVAHFIDQATQAPVQIQCVQQTTPEPMLKWLLPTIVQTVVSLLSIFAGVGIAVRSFRANKKTEHEQWVRDQKKAEWKQLLEGVANINGIVYLGQTVSREIAERIKNELKPAIQALSMSPANCIFLKEFQINSENEKKITDFINSAYITSNKISTRLELHDSKIENEASSEVDRQKLARNAEVIFSDCFEFAGKTRDLLLWLQEEAAKDLIS